MVHSLSSPSLPVESSCHIQATLQPTTNHANPPPFVTPEFHDEPGDMRNYAERNYGEQTCMPLQTKASLRTDPSWPSNVLRHTQSERDQILSVPSAEDDATTCTINPLPPESAPRPLMACPAPSTARRKENWSSHLCVRLSAACVYASFVN